MIYDGTAVEPGSGAGHVWIFQGTSDAPGGCDSIISSPFYGLDMMVSTPPAPQHILSGLQTDTNSSSMITYRVNKDILPPWPINGPRNAIIQMNPDGQCGWRAMAYSVFGNQQKWQEARHGIKNQLESEMEGYFIANMESRYMRWDTSKLRATI